MDYTHLNPKQLSAVTNPSGAVMVLAGPGSGKTTVITFRALHLIQKMGVDPASILVITFTKSATEEMRRRFLKLSGEIGGAVTFNTFHALFYRILRQRYGSATGDILGDDERRETVKRILKARNLEIEDDFLKGVLNEISRIKNDLIDIRYFNSMLLNRDDFLAVYNGYEEFKGGAGKLDFDDMLTRCYDLLKNEPQILEAWQNRYGHILVDEFQDINTVQYLTMSMLAAKGDVFIVGDDDQSIYRFRGAKPEFLRRFAKDFPRAEQIILDVNYRSTRQIVTVCNKVIAHNKGRFAKSIRDAGKTGPPVGLLRWEDSNAEAAGIAQVIRKFLAGGANPEEIAVIYRVNVQSRALTDAFMNAHVPYVVKDEAPGVYEHWIARDIRAYLAAARDPRDGLSAARIINKPKRYISNVAVETAKKAGGDFFGNLYGQKILQVWQLSKLDELLRQLKAMSGLNSGNAVKYIRQRAGYDTYIWEYSRYRGMNADGLYEILDELQDAAKAFEAPEDFVAHMDEAVADAKRKKLDKKPANDKRVPGVILTTMHSAKGLEFETVFVSGAVEGYIPYERSKTEAEIEEERRLFYVGLTRARVNLYISLVERRYEKRTSPSRFLEGLDLGIRKRKDGLYE